MTQYTRTSEPSPPSRLATWLLPSIVDLVFIRMFYNILIRPIHSLDIWWHLKTGELIVRNGSIPQTNLYSFTAPNSPWITHEWLTQVMFYGIWSIFGWNGLIFLRSFIFAVMIIVIYRTMVLCGAHFLLAIGIILIGSQLLVPAATLRPWLFTNFLAAVMVYLTVKKPEDTRWFILVPGLLWLWSNLHGSYPIGFIIAIFHGLELWTNGKRPVARFYALCILAAVPLLFVNPNGLHLLTYPLQYRLGSLFFAYITEWQQPDFHSIFGLLLEFYCGLVLVAIVFGRPPMRLIAFIKVLVFAHLALTAQRNAPYLMIVTAPFVAERLMALFRDLRNWIELKAKEHGGLMTRTLAWFAIESDRLAVMNTHFRRHSYLVVFLIGVVLFLSVSPEEAPDAAYNYRDNLSETFPIRAVEELSKHYDQKPVFNYFNWGGYLIWQTWPDISVFIDGRADPYPPSILKEYYETHHLVQWRETLDRYAIGWVIYPASEPLTKILEEAPEWEVFFRDDRAVLFKRTSVSENPN